MGTLFVKSALAVVLLCTFAFPLAAQTNVEEHWSGYDYPKQIPAGVNFHVVTDGDTLWALAAQYLKNPLLWPQIYQANDYIKDPNLIYPGDPIVLTVVWSAHRAAAFEACLFLMEELKPRAPFWKKENLQDGHRWVEKNTPG